MIAATPYDPLQLAVRQSAALDQRPLSSAPSAFVADAIKLLAWIELGEETMLRAEDDCLVEYDPRHHALLHQLYDSWLSLCRRLLTAADNAPGEFAAEDLAQLRSADQRVALWLQIQNDIQRATLSDSELHDRAARANLSAGVRGVSPPADG